MKLVQINLQPHFGGGESFLEGWKVEGKLDERENGHGKFLG